MAVFISGRISTQFVSFSDSALIQILPEFFSSRTRGNCRRPDGLKRSSSSITPRDAVSRFSFSPSFLPCARQQFQALGVRRLVGLVSHRSMENTGSRPLDHRRSVSCRWSLLSVDRRMPGARPFVALASSPSLGWYRLARSQPVVDDRFYQSVEDIRRSALRRRSETLSLIRQSRCFTSRRKSSPKSLTPALSRRRVSSKPHSEASVSLPSSTSSFKGFHRV